MSNFLIVDKLVVNTQFSGQCCIELCQGDITDLDVKDKVDVICVSVFGSRYTPLSDTLVGALHEKLKLSVKLLARDKAEDLRHAYMCWWSKPLPDHLPYRKLLCFENRGKVCRPQELVGNVFRCLVPILNNEPGTVVTPLLNTGIQGVDEATMLVGMVEAAIKWMKAGLPLKQLKIVMFAKVVKGKVVQVNMRNLQGVLKSFKELKERYNNSDVIPLDVPLEYDIYLSHSPEDDEIASTVEARFRASKPDIRIYKSKHALDEVADGQASFWQEEVFNVMLRSARVVPILSAAFLESKACVDLYNMALCCNRRAQRDLLAPLYIERIEDMPTYMGLVQYLDCSPKDEAKIGESCRDLVKSLERDSLKVHSEMVMADDSPLHYDIFVSYSHQDSRLAVSIVEKLQKLNPKLKIFFDRQELKVGIAWQRTLYHAIDGCRSFMALVSNTYTKSAMCIEEFNLALAKHCSSDSMIRLVPVCIERLVDSSPEFQQVKLINATPCVFDPAVEIICTSLVDWIAGKDWYPQLDSVFRRRIGMIVDVSECAAERRRLQFFLEYGKGNNTLNCEDVEFPTLSKGLYSPDRSITKNKENEVCDVAFSCAPKDKLFVTFMARILREVSPGLVIKETADTENERLALMESARKVVVFLSANYLESVEQVEELHTVLLRQRYRSPTQVLFPVTIHHLPQLPTYFHLVPCDFNLTDPLWLELFTKHKIALPPNLEDDWQMSQKNSELQVENHVFIGLIAAAHSLLLQLSTESEHPPSPKTNHQPMLLNVLLLRAKVERLLKEVNHGAKEDKDEMVNRAGYQENYLLDVVDPPQESFSTTLESQRDEGLGSGTSCHKHVNLSSQDSQGFTNPNVNTNSSLSHTHYPVKEREVAIDIRRSEDDTPQDESHIQHRKEGSSVKSTGWGSTSDEEKHTANRISSRSCMLV
ncbi:uncharacterized protein LOC119734686 [Patiria miniata]|uniref:TIR domain-containing protein n=1 Tax=Patiria miniata TaxID=46514 RepID=A0A914AKL8_PATMI|nr:uncharacterized protein LOC119734686 [Patiria miniata]